MLYKHVNKHVFLGMRVKTSLLQVAIFGMFLFVGVQSASAATYYVDGTNGQNSNDGLSWETAVERIQTAIGKATSEGDIVEISGGTYVERVNANRSGVTIQGSEASGHNTEVVLMSDMFPFIARAQRVSLRNVRIVGGSTFFSKAVRTTAADIVIEDVVIDAFYGIGISLEQNTTNVSIRDVEIIDPLTAISADGTITGVLDHIIARGYTSGSTPAAMMYLSGSTDLSLMNSFIAGGYRHCIKTEGLSKLTIRNSIIGGCGVEYTQSAENYSLIAVEGSVIDIDDSILNGYIRGPHTTVSSGATLGENVTINTFPDVEKMSANEAYLILSVDGREALSNADALASVIEGFGARMSYFIDSPDAFADSDWDVVKDMVARGHDIGSRARTNHLLTNVGPFQVAYIGSDTNVSLSIINNGTLLYTQGDTGADAFGPWDLVNEYQRVDSLCAAIDAREYYSCTLTITGSALDTISDYPSTTLQDATTILGSTVVTIPYDRRSFLEGGRFFTEALVNPKQVIEEAIGNAYQVVSFGYPGQQHDNEIRNMVKGTGYLIARGSANIAKSDHLWSVIEDVYQTPLILNYLQAKGTDYGTLSLSQQETRLRQFANAFSFSAMQSGIVASLKVHGSETLNTQELYWILDEVTKHGVTLVSLREFRQLLDTSWITTDGRAFTKTQTDQADYHLVIPSEQVDAGSLFETMATDADGLPIYGNPDIGPFEYQPPLEMGTDLLPVNETVRVYADGKFRSLNESGSGQADFSIEPISGLTTFDDDEARPWFVDVHVDTWGVSSSSESQWRETAPSSTGSTFHTLGGFEPEQAVLIYAQPEGGQETLIGVGVSTDAGEMTFTYEEGYDTTITFTLRYDTTAPTQPTLVAPAQGILQYSPGVMFVWEASTDSLSGLSQYVLLVDDLEIEIDSLFTEYTLEELSCGIHEWFVYAQDEAGNQTASERQAFTISCDGTIPSSSGGSSLRSKSDKEEQDEEPLDDNSQEGTGGGGEYLALSPVTGKLELVNQVYLSSVIKSPSFSTVYYVTQNFKRAPFPNEAIYFSWFETFDEIKMVTDATLATLELDFPMMPKSDVILVKTPSTPEVYVMQNEQGDPTRPDLYWIESEAQALEWFGSLWALYVLDIDPTILSRLEVYESPEFDDVLNLLKTLVPRTTFTQRANGTM